MLGDQLSQNYYPTANDTLITAPYNPQPFETQNDTMCLQANFLVEPNKISDNSYRAAFTLRVQVSVIVELLFAIVMITIGLYTDMWKVLPNLGALFIIAFFLVMWLQLMLFLGAKYKKKGILVQLSQIPYNYIVLVLHLVFYGFLITTICIYTADYFGIWIVWFPLTSLFVMVTTVTLYTWITKVELSYKIASIFTISPTLIIFIILLSNWPNHFDVIFPCFIVTLALNYYFIFETKQLCNGYNNQWSDWLQISLLLYAIIFLFLARMLSHCHGLSKELEEEAEAEQKQEQNRKNLQNLES